MGLEDRLSNYEQKERLRKLYEVDYDRSIAAYLEEKSSVKRKDIVVKIRNKILRNANRDELKDLDNKEEVYSTLDHYIRRSIIDFVKKPLHEANIAKSEGGEKLARDLEKHVFRLNGVNYSVTHFFASAEEGINHGTSVFNILHTIIHDSVEDKIGYIKKFNDKIPTDKEIERLTSNFLKPIKKCKHFDYDVHKGVLDRLTKKPTQNYMVYVAEGIKLNYFIGNNSRRKTIDGVLHFLDAKYDDRLNNTVTMRPIAREYDLLLQEASNKTNFTYAFSNPLDIAEYLEVILDFEDREGIVYDAETKNYYLPDDVDKKKPKGIHDMVLHGTIIPEVNGYKKKFENVHNYLDKIDIRSNTTKHSFIIGMIYKNLIVISQTNRFLKETVFTDTHYENNSIVDSVIKKRDELINRTLHEIKVQYSHPLAMHKELDTVVGLNYMRDARHSRNYEEFTPISKDENLPVRNGVVQYWLRGTLDKEPSIVSALNEPSSLDNDHLKFNLYLTLEHLFKQFGKGSERITYQPQLGTRNLNNWNYEQFTRDGKLDIKEQ